MVREERPGVDGEGPRRRERGQARDEIAAIGIVAEQWPALDAAHHDVVQDPGGVEARLPGHGGSPAQIALFAIVPYMGLPPLLGCYTLTECGSLITVASAREV